MLSNLLYFLKILFLRLFLQLLTIMASTATTNGGRSILADAEDHIVMQALPSIENDQADSHIPDLTLTNQSAFVTTQEDIPPDGGYGWVCAVCVFFINAHTWGANSVCDPGHFQS